jgi:hypothetical protein
MYVGTMRAKRLSQPPQSWLSTCRNSVKGTEPPEESCILPQPTRK